MKTHAQETSIAQYHSLTRQSNALCQREAILEHIKTHGGAWSIGEIAKALNWEKSTVSARFNELAYGTCQLIEYPKRKDRISGVMIRPLGLPPVGQGDLF